MCASAGGGMVAVAPFIGLRFDAAVVGDPGLVITPPYDAITTAARDAFEARSPYSVVRLILAHGDGDQYDHAAKLLASWRQEGALTPEGAPALYVYEEAYPFGGKPRAQRGVLATVRLDAGATWVLPHERTMPGPVADRRRLLAATRTNLSPLFGIYRGGGRPAAVLADAAAGEPAVDSTDDAGVRHRLWPVTDPGRIAAWCELLHPHQVLIADGHHRYQASLDHQRRMRQRHGSHPADPWDATFMFLVDADEAGPQVQSVHRILAVPASDAVERLRPWFDARRAGDPADVMRMLAALPPGVPALGVYGGPTAAWVLQATDPAALAAEAGLDRPPLDVETLHGPVLARLGVRDTRREITFESDLAQAIRLVDERVGSAVLLRPVPFEAIMRLAQQGVTLPQKSTSFYPKPRDGLVLRPLDQPPACR